MSWLDDIFDTLKVRSQWSTPKPFAEDKKTYFVTGKKQAKKEVVDKLLDLIEQARNKSLPLGFLTDEIKKL